MQKICDLYLRDAVGSDLLRFVSLFDQSFSPDAGKVYRGYLGVNISRVKLVTILSELRKGGVACFNVPIEYRDGVNISLRQASILAAGHAREKKALVASTRNGSSSPPVFWLFDLVYGDAADEKAGGVVMIDRLDGHAWSDSEYEEYMYDYNNVLN